MDAITFRTVVGGEQVIRPPADVVLPQGALEVTVRPVGSGATEVAPSVAAANARLRQCRVSVGRVMGTENEGIDADLARVYGDRPATKDGEARR